MSEYNEAMFKAFCSGEDGRYKLSKPWVKGGYRYATNGRICIRQRCDEPDTPTMDLPFPPAASLFDSGEFSVSPLQPQSFKSSWTEWPDMEYGHPTHVLGGEYATIAAKFGITLYAPTKGMALKGIGPNGEEALFMPRTRNKEPFKQPRGGGKDAAAPNDEIDASVPLIQARTCPPSSTKGGGN